MFRNVSECFRFALHSACEQGTAAEEEQIDLGASDAGCKIPTSADAYLRALS